METYWKKMTQCKFELLYLQEYLKLSVQVNRYVSVVTAIFSSASIAAWAASGKYAFFWSTLIAISQIVTVVNEFLPYKKLIPELSEMSSKLSVIYMDMEKDWKILSNKDTSENEEIEICYNYLLKWSEASDKFFKNDALTDNKKCLKRAHQKQELYYNNDFQEDFTLKEKPKQTPRPNIRHDGSLPIQPSVPKMPEPKRPQKPQSKP